MGSISPELSLDFRPTFVPKLITDFIKQVSMIGNVSEKASKLNDYLKGFEEELKKIDAFKRELPLCMLLLNEAILALRDASVQFTEKDSSPVLEEFIPLKKQSCYEDEKEEDSLELAETKMEKDKKNWMSSVQLWNTDEHPKQNQRRDIKRNDEEDQFRYDVPFPTSKNRADTREFLPFKRCPEFLVRKEEKEDLQFQGFSLLTPGIKNQVDESGAISSSTRGVSSSALCSQSNFRSGPHPQQTSRKQRRCWSPELHRRFISALEQLGGTQVATPKQIRELMQVDGLTNDEVKSHLQKYRLHMRRQPSNKSNLGKDSVAVLGGNGNGLWMHQDRYVESSKGSSPQSGSPQGPMDFPNGGTSSTSTENDEDSKSESYNWKGHKI